MWNEVEKIIGNDISKFPKELIDKAMQENSEAIFQIGRIYEQGLIISMNDRKACRIFELCADSGMMESRMRIADKIFRGQGTVRNIQKVKELLSKLLKEKMITAFVLMGDIMYQENQIHEAILYYLKAEEEFGEDTQGVDEYYMAITYGKLVKLFLYEDSIVFNAQKAVYYMDKALKSNVFCNAKEVGDLFYYGKGMEKNIQKAEFYYERIASEEMCMDCNGKCNEYCQKQLYSIWYLQRKEKSNINS